MFFASTQRDSHKLPSRNYGMKIGDGICSILRRRINALPIRRRHRRRQRSERKLAFRPSVAAGAFAAREAPGERENARVAPASPAAYNLCALGPGGSHDNPLCDVGAGVPAFRLRWQSRGYGDRCSLEL
jgi:hypothetical protein